METSSQELFDYLSKEHGLTLVQSELQEIENIVLEDYLGEEYFHAIKRGGKVEMTFINGEIDECNFTLP